MATGTITIEVEREDGPILVECWFQRSILIDSRQTHDAQVYVNDDAPYVELTEKETERALQKLVDDLCFE